MSYQLSSAVKPGSGLTTPPITQLVDVSGARPALPLVMTESWSVEAVFDPEAGKPRAPHLLRTAVSLLTRRACVLRIEHGSSIAESKRDGPPLSSPMVGARKPSAQEARKRTASTGFQLMSALKAVCEKVLPVSVL